jgi:uncharacterized protein YdhG (YjbR/CyaY superfamily)
MKKSKSAQTGRAVSGKRSRAVTGGGKSRPSKKATATRKKAPAKKKAPAFATVAEYLARVPEPARSALNQIRAAIREVVPAETTEVISYNIPAFRHNKVLVWYAAFAHHCSVFPGSAVIEQFKDELTGYTISKGTVQFPLDRPMPLELIKKLTQARVQSE